MENIIPIYCPKCNSHSLYKYGKDKFGNQKYQCRKCKHQFAPDFILCDSKGAKPLPPEQRKYFSCPICGKSAFLHHDYDVCILLQFYQISCSLSGLTPAEAAGFQCSEKQ